MCFWIHSKYKEAITATKDIRCWKITYSHVVYKDGFISSIQAFHYKFNKTYKTTVKREGIRITKGFHSFSQKPYIIDEKTICCIIPKGSKYYYNPDFNEYVSNQIIPLKVVKNKHYE